MANTININIKNCCCCGGTGTGETTGEITPITDLPDPTGIEGPPDGYGPPTTISDRQCRVAIFLYEWLYWWLDAAINSTPGYFLTNLLVSDMPFVAKAALMYALMPVVNAALASLVTWGIDIADVVIAPLTYVLSLLLAHSLVNLVETETVTIPVIEDTLAKIPTYRDQIICKLSQAENQAELQGELDKVLEEVGFSDAQRALVFAIFHPSLIGLLFWSADWWDSFDTVSLASITANCCGTLEPGYPLLPGSVTRCEASNYVLFQFMLLLQQTGEYVNDYWDTMIDFELDVEAEAYDDIQANIDDIVPRKVKETAFSLSQFERYLAKFVSTKFWSWNPLETSRYDTTFQDLGSQLLTNAEDIICGLYTALNASQAATVLIDEIDTFLATTSLDTDLQSYVKTALLGIISGEGDFIGLLFTQDSDILGFAAEFPCDDCGWVDPGDPSDTVFDFEVSDQGWVIWEDMSHPDPSWLYRGPGYYPEALFHSGAVSGVGTARLAIYYPSLVTVDDITVYARGTSEILDQLSIYVSDDMVNWTAIASKTSISANYDTEQVFEDLGIVDQYVMVYCRRFWSGANCGIRLVSFHTDGA